MDEEIEHFKVFLRNMGRAGIPAYIQNGLVAARRRAFQRAGKIPAGMRVHADAADLENARTRACKKRTARTERLPGREVWSTFTYFVCQVILVAEKAGVKIAIHPNEAFLN